MAELTVPVTIELGTPLFVPELQAGVAVTLPVKLSELLDELGVAGDPQIRVLSGTSTRMVRVKVFDRVRHYSRRLMLRAWRVVAPPELHDLARQDAPNAPRGFPDAWMGLAATMDLELMTRMVCRLALEAIKASPGCLVGLSQAEVFAQGARAPLDLLSEALALILDLGLSLKDRDRMMETLASAYRLGISVEDAAEAVFDGMRSERIEVRIPPSYLALTAQEGWASGTTLGAELERRLPILEDTLALELGIMYPQFALVADGSVDETEMGVRINDQMSLIPTLRPGEILLDETPARLEQRGLSGRAFPNPATREECVAVSESLLPEVHRLGLSYWTPAGFVALAVYAEVWRLAHRVISAEQLQRRLAQLEHEAPTLVSCALSRFTTWDIVRVARGLASEGIAPRDLRSILELMVQFATLPVDEDSRYLYDDRPPAGRQGGHNDAEAILRWVRAGLRSQITEHCTQGRDFIVALRLEEEAEARAAEQDNLGLRDAEADRLLDALWVDLMPVLSSAHVNPVVLTSRQARAAVRALVRDELPGDVPVVAEEEVLPHVKIHILPDREGRMHAQVAITADRVGRFLERLVGGPLSTSGDSLFDLVVGATPIRVEAVWEGDGTVIEISTVTNREVPASGSLFRWLAEHAQDSRFGHLGCTVDEGNVTVLCRHALLGDFLDFEELRLAVRAVAERGAEAAALITAQFGGVPAFEN